MIKLRWVGLKRFRRDMDRGAKKLRPALRRNLGLAAEAVVGEAQRHGFRGSRTRARFRISGGRRVARIPPWPVTSPPSKLGVFTGFYRRAISKDIKQSGRRLTAEVGPVGVRYARAHEFGVGRMPERPVIGPAVKAQEKYVYRLLGRTFEVLR